MEYNGNALEDFEEQNTVILMQATVASRPLSLLVATTHPSVTSPSVLLSPFTKGREKVLHTHFVTLVHKEHHLELSV